ncbi:MAG TPA: KH domain-containing protein [Bacteroidota bacterium]
MEGMKEFVEFIARRLVDHPDELSLEQEEKENSIIVRIKVGEADVGKIIGKKGRTAQSLRTLLSAVAAKSGKRAILEIAD